jgi:hypothetical protein
MNNTGATSGTTPKGLNMNGCKRKHKKKSPKDFNMNNTGATSGITPKGLNKKT